MDENENSAYHRPTLFSVAHGDGKLIFIEDDAVASRSELFLPCISRSGRVTARPFKERKLK